MAQPGRIRLQDRGPPPRLPARALPATAARRVPVSGRRNSRVPARPLAPEPPKAAWRRAPGNATPPSTSCCGPSSPSTRSARSCRSAGPDRAQVRPRCQPGRADGRRPGQGIETGPVGPCPGAVADDLVLVVSELVTNAIRDSRSGADGGTYTVRVAHLVTEKVPYVWVEVLDQGSPAGDGILRPEPTHGLSVIQHLSTWPGTCPPPATPTPPPSPSASGSPTPTPATPVVTRPVHQPDENRDRRKGRWRLCRSSVGVEASLGIRPNQDGR